MTSDGGPADAQGGTTSGGGCHCALPPGPTGSSLPLTALLGTMVFLGLRRRRR